MQVVSLYAATNDAECAYFQASRQMSTMETTLVVTLGETDLITAG